MSREQLVQMLAAALLDWRDQSGIQATWPLRAALPGAPEVDVHRAALVDARELLRVIEENQAALRRPVQELGG